MICRIDFDRIASHPAVGEYDEAVVVGSNCRSTPRDRLDSAEDNPDSQSVADLIRFLDVERNSREEIAQSILQGEAKYDGQNR
jgi:hypothetical protein